MQYAHGRYGTFTKTWNFPPGCKYAHTADHIVCREAVIALGKKVEVHTVGGVKEFEAPKPGLGGRAQAFMNLIEAIESTTRILVEHGDFKASPLPGDNPRSIIWSAVWPFRE